MKNGITKIVLVFAAVALAEKVFAQTASSNGSSILLGSIILVSILLVLGVVIMVGDNLIAIEAKQRGLNKKGINLSVFPNLKEIMSPKLAEYVNGGHSVKVLKKGFDIKLLGAADPKNMEAADVKTFAIQPPDFRGIAPIPKLEVEIGSSVKAGDPIFHDKLNPDIKYVAPVSGELIALNRGDKRAVHELVILADKSQQFRTYQLPDLGKASRAELVSFMLGSGAWTLIRQRPFNTIADPQVAPVNVFISTFDTAPLAPDSNLLLHGREAAFQKGLDVLGLLTSGKVHLGLNAKGDTPPAAAFVNAAGVEKHWFHGAHPAGNVGVQIHHIAPLNSGDTVWTLGVQEVITLGTLFLEGKWDTTRVVALTGDELNTPKYVVTNAGAHIADLLKDNIKNSNVRIISGDVLSGSKKTQEQFLGYYDDQLTVVAEGDYYEMFGWLLPQKSRPSVSHSYPNFLFPDTKFKADTNTHGEERAFVVTGQYEDMLPMDIYPQHLMKAILAKDFEKMEGLGIYELVEEDVALCEFSCTSKQPLQKILREGLDMMHEQS